MFDNNNRGGGSGNNSGHSVETSKSSGTSPPARALTKKVKVKFAVSQPALNLLMKHPRAEGCTRDSVRVEVLKAVQLRAPEEIAMMTQKGSRFWLSLIELPGLTLVNIFDFQQRPKRHPLRNSVVVMAVWEALEDAHECGFALQLEALLMGAANRQAHQLKA